jgi:hypothetical protein
MSNGYRADPIIGALEHWSLRFRFRFLYYLWRSSGLTIDRDAR